MSTDKENVNKLIDKWCDTPNWMPPTQLELHILIHECYMVGKDAEKEQMTQYRKTSRAEFYASHDEFFKLQEEKM